MAAAVAIKRSGTITPNGAGTMTLEASQDVGESEMQAHRAKYTHEHTFKLIQCDGTQIKTHTTRQQRYQAELVGSTSVVQGAWLM